MNRYYIVVTNTNTYRFDVVNAATRLSDALVTEGQEHWVAYVKPSGMETLKVVTI